VVIKSKQDILPRIATDQFGDENIHELKTAPVHDGAEFIRCALVAAENVPVNTRKTIQSDIANVLNCKGEALSFLWAYSVKNAEVLDCVIPDFRAFDKIRRDVESAAE